MADFEDQLIENVREALRAYERFVFWSTFCSFLMLVYVLDRQTTMVPVGYGQIRVDLAFLGAVALYFGFGVAARHALLRGAECIRHISPNLRKVFQLVPTIAVDYRPNPSGISFRVIVLAIGPALFLAAMLVDLFKTKPPLVGWAIAAAPTVALVATVTLAIWAALREFELATVSDKPALKG